MAGQDPLKPRDDGKIGMPQILPGMNKIAPQRTQGDKGQRQGMLGGKQDMPRSKVDELLTRARRRMENAVNNESENRAAGLEDLNFLSGKQWPSEIAAQRNLDKRPCLTINKLPTFVNQIVNPLREDRPTINVSPVGERSDLEVARMYRGLIRAIERDCFADIAYDWALANGAGAPGWGFWELDTEWETPDSFNQVIVIRRVMNPFTVYLDTRSRQPDGADARWAFKTEMMGKRDFEDDYPGVDPIPYQQVAQGDSLKDWITKDEIRIAIYYEVENTKRTLVSLSNGHIGWEDELDEVTRARLRKGTLQKEDEREADDTKIWKYKLTGLDVIEKTEWAGKWIPIVRVVGNEMDVEGKVKLSGVVRNSKDAQRMYNYWRTLETELIALQPKAPWIMEEGQVEGHEDEWKMANIRSNPYLLYKGTSVAGHPAPPPQRQPFAGAPQGVEAAIAGAAQDMMATTGIRFDATLEERTYDESGRALRELRRTGDIGSAHYGLNFARSLRHTGEMLVDLIPKIYDTRRVVTILRDDDKEESIIIDPSQNKPMQEATGRDGKYIKLFNPTIGRYGVTVTIGPSYATKRIEAAENMIAFARAMPQTAGLFADLIAKNMDWPGSEEIAARIAKTLPPNLLTPDNKDMSPQVQALITGMDGQIKQLTMQLQAAMHALNDKQQDRAIDIDKINKDFEAKLLQIVSNVETKMAAIEQKQTGQEMHVGATQGSQIKDLAQGVKLLTEMMHLTDQSDPLMTLIKSHDQMLDRMQGLDGTIEKLQAEMKKPKKIKINRGKDGLATDATVSTD